MAVLKSPPTLAARPARKRLSASAWTEATKLTAATTAKMSRTMAFAGCGMEIYHSILRPRQTPALPQLSINEKHMQGFIAVSEPMEQLYDGVNPDKPDPKLEAQAEALVKKHGFASLDEYDDVSMNIVMIISGIDPQTKRFTEPPEQINKQNDAVRSDKSVPEAQKKEVLVQLEAALKDAKPIQFRENIALVVKHFDELIGLVQGQRPAD